MPALAGSAVGVVGAASHEHDADTDEEQPEREERVGAVVGTGRRQAGRLGGGRRRGGRRRVGRRGRGRRGHGRSRGGRCRRRRSRRCRRLRRLGRCALVGIHVDRGVDDVVAGAVANHHYVHGALADRGRVRHREGACRLGAEFVLLAGVDDDVVGGTTQVHGELQDRFVVDADDLHRGGVLVDDGRRLARAEVHDDVGRAVGRDRGRGPAERGVAGLRRDVRQRHRLGAVGVGGDAAAVAVAGDRDRAIAVTHLGGVELEPGRGGADAVATDGDDVVGPSDAGEAEDCDSNCGGDDGNFLVGFEHCSSLLESRWTRLALPFSFQCTTRMCTEIATVLGK